MAQNLVFEMTCVTAAVGSGLVARFELRNVGTEQLVVNQRLALNPSGTAGEVHLQAVGPRGGAVPVIADVNLGRPQREHFGPLSPGEHVSREYDLERYLLLTEPGEYRLRATYRNDVNGTDGSAAIAWTGEVTAEPVTVTVPSR